jgi:putative aminopeptidase FrvX
MHLGDILVNLKALTELEGVSGNEEKVRNYIRKNIEEYVDDIKIDSIGNLIAFKKGKFSETKVMIASHMDEVGFMVTGHTEGGFLKFKPVGGIDDRILPGKRVLIGEKRIPGVICSKAIHLQDKDEFKSNIKVKNMYIDIGCEKKEEAEDIAPLGEYISFNTKYMELEDDSIKSKAMDDRAGCAVLMELLKKRYDFDLYACFTVQEEVGLRGAQVAAYIVKPDIAFVMESTTCSDVPGVEEYEYSTNYGSGAAISLMDRTSFYSRICNNIIFNMSETS